MPVATGTRLGAYEVVGLLGAGGMGEVYRARDTRLRRDVALKVLPPLFAADPERRARFTREAHVLATLNHPNIAAIYGVEETDGVTALVLELVEGVTLADRLAGGPVPTAEALQIAEQIAAALDGAHEQGIIHRDLKPTNIALTAAGRVKVLDFGLAKRAFAPEGLDTQTMSALSVTGALAGTVPYMSPEQLRGEAVDGRTDIWAFGCVLFELLSGRPVFHADSSAGLIASILEREPDWSALPASTPADLRRIVDRCLKKNADARYGSASDLARELRAIAARESAPRAPARRMGRRTAVLAASGLVLGATILAASVYRWERARSFQRALDQIDALSAAGRYAAAYAIVQDLQHRAPGDSRLDRALDRFTFIVDVDSEPAGAVVDVRDYADPSAAWNRFGTTPMPKARVPNGAPEWRVTKPGFAPADGRFGWGLVRVRLAPLTNVPTGMVLVPGGRTTFEAGEWSRLPDYWISRYETTNREFAAFVAAGGYSNRAYWKQPFISDGRVLSWDAAMARFTDRTGRPGPSTWELGRYPTGEGDLPVHGISWYEAAAFAEFSGASLPTVTHWQKAAGVPVYRDDVRLANFGGAGPRAITALKDLGPYGTYGLAGNVKEWCWNEINGQRYILGGSWNEPIYMAMNPDARPPFDRAETNGVRLVKYTEPPAAPLLASVNLLESGNVLPKPVSDAAFEAMRGFYAYEHRPLDARVERVEESDDWRKEKVTIAAAYGHERVPVYLFIPKSARPPYQTVIWYPGSYDYLLPTSDQLSLQIYWDFLPKTGRAFVYPVYEGFMERRVGAGPPEGLAFRDMLIQQSKDLGRVIDYLETRPEFDRTRLAYYGFSAGASDALPLLAIESRLRALVLLSAGFGFSSTPEVDSVNFIPRIRTPLLMLNGRFDFLAPPDVQRRLFAMFGTRPADKRYVMFDAGHVPARTDLIREILDFLDAWLGPVAR
jgi:formylglycine-generating enzyme required for sulfatase activity/dienelactone hydrolase